MIELRGNTYVWRLRLGSLIVRLIVSLVVLWPIRASSFPFHDQSAASSNDTNARPAGIWQTIRTAIQITQADADAARRADRIAALLDVVDAEVSLQPKADVIHIDGRSKITGARAEVHFSDVGGSSADSGVSFEVQILQSDDKSLQCIEYHDIEHDLHALGAVGDLKRDVVLEGLHMPSGTVAILSKTLLGFVYFYMPLNDAGPICLTRMFVRNYDGGVPAWANSLRR